MNAEDPDDDGDLYFLPGGIVDDSPPRRNLDVHASSPLASSFGAIGASGSMMPSLSSRHLNSFLLPTASDASDLPNNSLLSGLGGVAVPTPARDHRQIGGFGGYGSYGSSTGGMSSSLGIGSIGSSIGATSCHLGSQSSFARAQQVSYLQPKPISSTTGAPLRAPPGLDAPVASPYERSRNVGDEMSSFGFMSHMRPTIPPVQQAIYRPPGYHNAIPTSNMELAELNTTSVVVTHGRDDDGFATNTIGVNRFRSHTPRALSEESIAPSPVAAADPPPRASTPLRKSNRGEQRQERKDHGERKDHVERKEPVGHQSFMKRSSTLGSPSSVSSRDSEDPPIKSAPSSPSRAQNAQRPAQGQVRIRQRGRPNDGSPKNPETATPKGGRAVAVASSSSSRRATPVYREKYPKQEPQPQRQPPSSTHEPPVARPERGTPRRPKGERQSTTPTSIAATTVVLPTSSVKADSLKVKVKNEKNVPSTSTLEEEPVVVEKEPDEPSCAATAASPDDEEDETSVPDDDTPEKEEDRDADDERKAIDDLSKDDEVESVDDPSVVALDEETIAVDDVKEDKAPDEDKPSAPFANPPSFVGESSAMESSHDDVTPPNEEEVEVAQHPTKQQRKLPAATPASTMELHTPSSEDDMKVPTTVAKKKAEKKSHRREKDSLLKHTLEKKKSDGLKKKDSRKDDDLVDDPLFSSSTSTSSSSAMTAWKDAMASCWHAVAHTGGASKALSWLFVHLFSALSIVINLGIVVGLQLLTYGLKFHRVAVRGLVFNRNIACCFAFLYAFPLLVQYVIPWAPPWAPVCLWYAFLVQLFCTQGSTAMVATFRILLPLVFLVEGVSHHSFLLDLNGAELLLISFILSAVKTGNLCSPIFFLSLSVQCLSAVFLGSELIVQWAQLAVALYSLNAMAASNEDEWNTEEDGGGAFGHSPLLGDFHQPSGTSIQKTKRLDRRSLATAKGRKPRATSST
ncbi:Aste57867_21029 [Aphanomyces stellatus]|uniref:Aste57867_21029 protein n=1 Tax=Aphanomyces stellatus TaxID=120398 RepID=A0A485LGF1_9STRA|nr:hypothetical protein As57867_020961 [Aphanomyces stellatus]VFT97704.1 Aste57867_21029 [Aphanomyces stellatus]